MSTRKYELSFWLSSNLNESEAESLFNDITKQIDNFGGQILSTQIPQLKTLSYNIKKENNGYFSFVQFQGEEIKLDELKKKLNLNDKILRFTLVRISEQKQKAFVKQIRHISTRKITKTTPKEPEKEMSVEELDQKLNEILKE